MTQFHGLLAPYSSSPLMSIVFVLVDQAVVGAYAAAVVVSTDKKKSPVHYVNGHYLLTVYAAECKIKNLIWKTLSTWKHSPPGALAGLQRRHLQ